MNHLLLYVTSGCHLCEQAQQVIYAALGTTVAEADIIDNEHCYERYSVRIPVLFDRIRGAELDWPFDRDRVSDFVLSPASSGEHPVAKHLPENHSTEEN